MKFKTEKKESIIIYILEKIASGDDSISRTVAENFAINQSTVHDYLLELINNNIIRKIRRGKYELVQQTFDYTLSRAAGDLDDDIRPYFTCLSDHIKGRPKNIEQLWSYAFSEMINNVMDHSCCEFAFVTVLTDYLNTTTIIRDDGIGIFNKICKHFGLSSAQDAVNELFKGKLTTDSLHHSGEGIFFSSRMMDSFAIISEGTIFSNNRYNESNITAAAAADNPGTTVIMTLSNHSRKTPEEIFAQYSDSEGGFIRTRIHLKDIFDDAPISRSQAKRVCSRLEQFKEVILDFESIPWMGQGFAHQIFCVFTFEHPEVALIPENMNPEVLKMYEHVTRR